MNEDSENEHEEIAIIGIAGRFPEASSPDEFWSNLIEGKDCISRFPARKTADGAKYTGARGIMRDPGMFDAGFFQIYPKEAELMDPQHRVFLECAWEALEDGAVDPAAFPGQIGVYAGLSLNTYLLHNLATGKKLAENYQVSEYQTMLGNDKDFLPVRVSYKLDLRGPSMTIQSACSTSLVAICQAATALMTWQCDLALAGGVSITFPQQRDYLFQEDGMVSPDGTCRTFDAEAKGTVFSHGCGVVLLKRLSEALADGDPIHGVIKGWAVNNDGSDKVGFAAPGVNSQAEVIALAQAAAAVSPAEISYIEAHGTGTPLGDPIEIAALTKAFRDGGAEENGFCRIGSGKTHIGHLDCAAGVTGLIKTLLQLRHGKIPGLLHFRSPNPHIDFASSPFVPAGETVDWPPNGAPRIAGVSAFGVGGTNAHVIVAEPPVSEECPVSGVPRVLQISARSKAAVVEAAIRLADHLEKSRPSLDATAFTLARGRRKFPHRAFVVAADLNSAITALRAEPRSAEAAGQPRRVAFLFPGQGAQTPGMTRGLYETQPVFRRCIDECAALLQPFLHRDIRHVLFPPEHADTATTAEIHNTALTQPCIFAVEYALAQLWIHHGVRPSLLIGHSIGEFAAAVIARSLSLEDAAQLVATRGALMQALPSGSMLAVRAAADSLILPDGVTISAYNSPALCTLGGASEKIAAYHAELTSCGIQARVLETSHAFHSAAMEPIMARFASDVSMAPISAPEIPWVSTATGNFLDAETISDPAYWARQLREPVRFTQALETALADDGLLLLETGPGRTLAQFARQHPAIGTTPVFSSYDAAAGDERAGFLTTCGELWKLGVVSEAPFLDPQPPRQRIHLPTYPFQRENYWIDRSQEISPKPPKTPVNPSIPPACGLPQAVVVSAPAAPPASARNRRETLADNLRTLIHELSGVRIADDRATFTELGFDSLFLTQAAQAIMSRWGAKVTFRQMLGELSSVATLAKHLDDTLPPDAVAATPAAMVSAVQSATGQNSLPTPAASGALGDLLAENLRLMHSMLAGQGAPAAALATHSTVTWPSTRERKNAASTSFGPFKPLDSGEKGGLTPKQQQALAAFISRYTAKTGKSKAYTAEHRPHFADPRAVSGFKSQWKEMVYPIVSAGGKGSRLRDIDGNEYVDITMGFGTYFFGHSPDWLVETLHRQLDEGIEIGPQSAIAGDLAREIAALTSMDRVTFCNTGSEAVMAAIRLARTVTGRDRVVYFTGDYHGMFEEVLVRGSWVDGVYKPRAIAPGIPQSLVDNMLVLDYADPASLEILRTHGAEIAAVLVEPVQSRAPGLQPGDFMKSVREITRASGTALVFDEVVTGFRCAPGGAQQYFGIKADLATYGKVIGGGMPIGVLAGKSQFMDALDGGMWQYGDDSIPETGVTFFAGTFVRHPLAMAAARRVVAELKAAGPRLQIDVEERVARLCRTLDGFFRSAGVPLRIPHFSAFAGIEHAPELTHASLLWYLLREKGIHVWEGRPLYFTTAHTDEDFDQIIRAFVAAVTELQNAGFFPVAENPAAPPVGFPRCDSAPTTAAQREIFHGTHMGDEANCAFNESNIIRFDGPLDPAALRSALHDIIVRHPALRSTISADGETQFFHPSPESVDLTEHDFTAFDAASPAAKLPATLILKAETSVPFDLVNGPLVRCNLLRFANDRAELVFSAHHIVCDGWSFGMILMELAAAYNARKAGNLPLLPPATSFADHARAEKARTGSPEVLAAEAYWIGRFSDGAPVLDLPTDRPRPPVKTSSGAMETLTLEPEIHSQLKSAAPTLGGTMFATLLASFGTLLHRITGQEDLVIGVPAAGQTRAGTAELVGHCLNFLPLRLRPTVGSTFREFAAQVRDEVLEAYDHQDHTFGSLLRKLNLPRDPSRVPLVSAIFNIDKNGTENIRFNGLDFEVETNPKQFVNFDLFFNLVQTEDKIVVECEYNTDLHDATTIRRWLAQYQEIIRSAVHDGSEKTGVATAAATGIPAPADAATLAAYEALNATTAPVPAVPSMLAFFEEQAAEHPQNAAIHADLRTITYRELDRHANALARTLIDTGVKSGQLVAVCADRRPETIVAILAVLKAGGAYIPVDPAYPAERITHILRDTAAPIVLTTSALAPALPSENTRVIHIDDALSREEDAPEISVRPEDAAYVIYTSGSTGVPKGVVIEHRNAIAFISWARTVFSWEEIKGVLLSTSICFDLSIFEIFVTLSGGGAMILVENALALGDSPHRDKITLINTVPSAIAELADADMIPASVKTINLAGELLTTSLVDRISEARPGVKIYDLYGPSEDTTYSTFALRKPGVPPVIGKPIANTRAYIVTESGALAALGTPGELYLGGTGLARGYLNRPELTAEKFIPDGFSGNTGARLYRTGDLVALLPSGELKFHGRLDHQVKLRGFRIELGEIESALEKHPAVTKAIATVSDGRLAAFYTAASETLAVGQTAADGTTIWRDQWDMLYSSAIDQSGTEKLDRLDSVIAGWAGIGNLDSQVDEWIGATVSRIRSLGGKRIYEIGCGTGQLLARLAPGAEAYWASDISKVAIDALRRNHPEPEIHLAHRGADDFSGLEKSWFDLVIINSVAQYFPSAEYLAAVIRGAAEVLRPGGRIFLGDVQSNALLPAHHAAALRGHAPAGATCGSLRDTLARRISRETELSVDPEWFARLAAENSGISHVETALRRGKIANETTTYHYDIIIHTGGNPDTSPVPAALEWGNMNAEQLEAALTAAPGARHYTGIPDARLAAPLAFLAALRNAENSSPLPDFTSTHASHITTEELHEIADRTGHRAHVRWVGDGSDGALEAVFLPRPAAAIPAWPQVSTSRPVAELHNVPAPVQPPQDLSPELRSHLAASLPEYMIPAAFILLEDFPLTQNGKVDRKALLEIPVPETPAGNYEKPRTSAEEKLAAIWRAVLGRQTIGINDDIFTLGGDSILIFQIATRANREGLAITPAGIFRGRTIATILAQATGAAPVSAAPAIRPADRGSYRRTL